MDIYFAALAHNCANGLIDNLNKLDKIIKKGEFEKEGIWIAENDSHDGTKNRIKNFSEDKKHVHIITEDGLKDRIQNRIKRISYMRQKTLINIKNNAKKSYKNSLYVPIDIDSKIARSIDVDSFLEECKYVIKGGAEAVFPISKPYYYDILALRKSGWVEEDCWNQIGGERSRTIRFLKKYSKVYKKQKSEQKLRETGRIEVDSAFCGLGIYRMDSLRDATYLMDNDSSSKTICEHVEFNKKISKKEISTQLVVKAPEEHIKFNSKASHKKIAHVSNVIISDIAKIVRKIASNISDSVRQINNEHGL